MNIKLLLSLLFFISAFALPAQPPLSLQATPANGLNAPLQVVNAGDGSNRFFVVEKGGRILAFSSEWAFLGEFLKISDLGGGFEGGLLSMVFHPDYEVNGFFFVYYVKNSGEVELARYQVSSANPNLADLDSKAVLLTIPHPDFEHHYGGELHFDHEGYLYLSTGDGGNPNDQEQIAQNKNSLLGKMLRIHPDTSSVMPYYSIPPDNPYGNEVIAMGLRNPFRWSFDRLTGDKWIGDVGSSIREELNFWPAGAPLGANFGWSCYEGDILNNTNACHPDSPYVSPAFAYYALPPVSIIGGLVYRGAEYEALQGYYFAAEHYTGDWFILLPDGNGGWNTEILPMPVKGIADFGESESGEVYVVSITEQKIYKLALSNSATEQPNELDIKVYPNLVREGLVYLDLQGAAFQSLKLLNLAGETLLSRDLSGQKGGIKLQISDLASGVYLLQMRANSGKVVTKKVFLVR